MNRTVLPLEVQASLQHPDSGLQADDLRDLLRLVNDTTQRLQSTHMALQGEVSRLQRELAEANAALRRSQALAALGEMAAGIAHEVRNPLGSIQLYVQLLAEDLRDRPAQAELCTKISRSVTGLDAIVRDVLSFSREMTIRPTRVSAAELFERALDACAALLREGIRVDRSMVSPLIFEGDVTLLTQAISNVIRNAAEAMLEANCADRRVDLGTVTRLVRGSNGQQESRIALSIRDHGPGIPGQVIERIFNPFFTTRATGTGLGLAIVHRIVDAHGGHIKIENHACGGAIVEICLPAHPLIPQQTLTAAGMDAPRLLNRSPQLLEHGA